MPISGKIVIKKLQKTGWKMVSQTGSHIKLKKEGKPVIVPVHGNRDLPRGTIKAIERQTGEKLL